MQFEILAPAGSMESLIAGVRCGAHAVYLGGQTFNARRGAGNFSPQELQAAVQYCHTRGVKVYMTLNTLVSDSELPGAVAAAGNALDAGVDAFIVQDLGLAAALAAVYPGVHLHASTQCSVTTPAGFQALEKMGFRRAVIPREMTAAEIEEIRRSTQMELELFVHGALCMCVSGQCYLSSVLGARSGNRGLCAQPCRLPFSADASGSCDLSLKDLSLVRHLKKIGDLGVLSLKIEGRMKRPEYVAAAVTAVKHAIAGVLDPADEAQLQSVFSRSGFTDGYFTDQRGSAMFGVRSKADVTAAKDVLRDLAHTYEKEQPLLGLNLQATCRAGEPVTLRATLEDGRTVTADGDVPQPARNAALTAESLAQRLGKWGGTPYYVKKIDIEIDDGLFLPAAAVNALRREIADRLEAAPPAPVERRPLPPLPAGGTAGKPYYTARFANVAQIPENHPFRRIFLPLGTPANTLLAHNAGVELPRGVFGIENKICQELAILKAAGVKNALCPDLGAVQIARAAGLEPYGDFGLNVFNSRTAHLLPHPLASFELRQEDVNRLAANGNDVGALVYGHLPLMLTRNCPVQAHIGCAACQKQGRLTDRKGCTFPVVCNPYGCTQLLNGVPLYMGDRMREMRTAYAHFYFSVESQHQVQQVLDLFAAGQKPDFPYTRGLYQRGAL